MGGRWVWEGRLEVREAGVTPAGGGGGGPWFTVCGALWGIREAMVVCRQMGHHYAKQALKTNYFGGPVRDTLIYAFNCTGREGRLSECPRLDVSANISCPSGPRRVVAGVTCTSALPDLVPDVDRLQSSVRLQDRPLYYLQCAMEENCLSSSAYALRNNGSNWRTAIRRLLRFSTVVHNRGDADFRPNIAKSNWQWHTCHMHFHSMEVFAHYDILDDTGQRLAEGSKASFCLEDSECDRGVPRTYDCEGFGDQGLSVNCSDNYMWNIDCQWIDITDIQPGIYTFLMEVNPQLLVSEKNFDNNVVQCVLWYSGYEAKFRDCHHASLLDYRR
ncbi:lysyl oxidase homolog 2B-like [Babylonia areolata]|uniref:lysyl oxidase homolog 2B-like n=1 Tax=Babylonia areolata TaxID=304850 RepID=UPI003FD21463